MDKPFWFHWLEAWKAIRTLEANDKKLEPVPPIGWRRVLLTAWLLPLLFLSPWFNGSKEWENQTWIWLYLAPGVILLPLLSLRRKPSLHVPKATLILLLAAGFAFFQTIPFASVGSKSWAPATVRMQRWALGENNEVGMGVFSSQMSDAVQRDSDLKGSNSVSSQSSDSNLLAISMDPTRTRLALANLCMAAILIWASAIAFEHRWTQYALMIALVIIGLHVASMSFVQHMAWKIPDWAFVRDKRSVGPFASKNMGGAYLNISIAAAIGLAWASISNTWRFSRKRDSRYSMPSEGRIANLWLHFSNRVRDLNTVHFLWILLVIYFVAAMVGSLCRGAALSGILTTLAIVYLKGRSGNKFAPTVLLTLVIIVALGFLALLDLDAEASESLSAMADGDRNGGGGGRLFVWWGAIRAFLFYCLTGCGFGCFRWGMLPFVENKFSIWYCYAESLWGHVIVELGIVGLVLMLAILREIVRLFKTLHLHQHSAYRNPATCACLFAIGAFGLHSFVDFGLILPGNSVPFCLLLGTAYAVRHSQALSHSKGEKNEKHRSKSKSEKPVITVQKIEAEGASEIAKEAKTISRKNRWHLNSTGPLAFIASWCLASLMIGAWLVAPPQIEADRQAAWLEKVQSTQQFVKGEKYRDDFIERWGEEYSSNAESVRVRNVVELGRWRRDYLKFAQSSDPKLPWYASDPVVIRVACARLFHKDESFVSLIGGEGPERNWESLHKKAQAARYQVPLDWRLLSDALNLNWKGTKEEDLLLANRMSVLSLHQPKKLVEVGWIGLEAGDQKFAMQCFKTGLNIDPNLTFFVGTVFSSTLDDSEIDVSFFPNSASQLERLASQIFPSSRFPKTNRSLWEKTRDLAKSMSSYDRKRWSLISKAEMQLGNIDGAIEASRQFAIAEDRIEAWLGLRSQLLRLKRSDEAYEVTTTILEKYPEDRRSKALAEERRKAER